MKTSIKVLWISNKPMQTDVLEKLKEIIFNLPEPNFIIKKGTDKNIVVINEQIDFEADIYQAYKQLKQKIDEHNIDLVSGVFPNQIWSYFLKHSNILTLQLAIPIYITEKLESHKILKIDRFEFISYQK